MNWRAIGLAVLTLAVGLLGLWFTLRVLEEAGRQPAPARPQPMEWREVLERVRREIEQEREKRGEEPEDQPGEERKNHGAGVLGGDEEQPGEERAAPGDGPGRQRGGKEELLLERKRPRKIWPAGDYPGLGPSPLNPESRRPGPTRTEPGLIERWESRGQGK